MEITEITSSNSKNNDFVESDILPVVDFKKITNPSDKNNHLNKNSELLKAISLKIPEIGIKSYLVGEIKHGKKQDICLLACQNYILFAQKNWKIKKLTVTSNLNTYLLKNCFRGKEHEFGIYLNNAKQTNSEDDYRFEVYYEKENAESGTFIIPFTFCKNSPHPINQEKQTLIFKEFSNFLESSQRKNIFCNTLEKFQEKNFIYYNQVKVENLHQLSKVGSNLIAARLTDIVRNKSIPLEKVMIAENEALESYNAIKHLSQQQVSHYKIPTNRTINFIDDKYLNAAQIKIYFSQGEQKNIKNFKKVVDYFSYNERIKSYKHHGPLEEIWEERPRTHLRSHLNRIFKRNRFDTVTSSALRKSLGYLTGTSNVFSPLFITGVYDYLVKNYEIKSLFDPCAGWGGMAISAIARNLDAYIGVDSNPRLKPIYENIFDFFSNINELDTKKQTFKLITDSIENVDCQEILGEYNGKIDCVFSSPPFFNLELYNNEDPNQSIYQKNSDNQIENRSYQDWKDHFLKDGYITKSDQALKENGILATHLMDFKKQGKYPLVNDYLEIMNEHFPHFKFLGFIELGVNRPLILLHQKTTGNHYIKKFAVGAKLIEAVETKRQLDGIDTNRKRLKRKEFDEEYIFSPDCMDENVFSTDYLDAAESLLDIYNEQIDNFPPPPELNPLEDLEIEEILDFAQKESVIIYNEQEEQLQNSPHTFLGYLENDSDEELELNFVGEELLYLKNNPRGLPLGKKKLDRQTILEHKLKNPLTKKALHDIRILIKKGAVLPDDCLDSLSNDPLSRIVFNYWLKHTEKPTQKLFETAVRAQVKEDTILRTIQKGVTTSNAICNLAKAKNYSKDIIKAMSSSEAYDHEKPLLRENFEEDMIVSNVFPKKLKESLSPLKSHSDVKISLMDVAKSKSTKHLHQLIKMNVTFTDLFFEQLGTYKTSFKIYKILAKKGISPSRAFLEKAIRANYPERIILYIIQSGIKPTIQLLDLALRKNYSQKIIETMVDSGALEHTDPLLFPFLDESNPDIETIDPMQLEMALKTAAKFNSVKMVQELIKIKAHFPDYFFEELGTTTKSLIIYHTLADAGILPSQMFFEKALRAKFPEVIIHSMIHLGIKPSILLLDLALSKNYSEEILNAMIDKGALLL